MEILKNKELTQLFLEKVIEKKSDYFIEVGCFEASSSIKISQSLPNCNVFAYEANPYNYDNFKDQLNKYKLNYVNKAISNYCGKTSFFLQQHKNYVVGNNSLLKRNSSCEYKEVQVLCDTLDNLNYEIDKKYSLWIDAEGHGLEVLEGSEKVLEKTELILIEVESIQYWKNQKLDKDVIRFLENRGFYWKYRDQEYPKQYNILFEKDL